MLISLKENFLEGKGSLKDILVRDAGCPVKQINSAYHVS